MGEQEHQAYEREEGKQIGLEILTLREVVQCAIALRPGDDYEEQSDQQQEDAAKKEEDPRRPAWGASGQ
jgi:hypothetical protein